MKINEFLEEKQMIEDRYREGEYTILTSEVDNFGTVLNRLRYKRKKVARATINNEKNVFDIDYLDINDLKFLLLKIIDNYGELHYQGSEIEILELGINKKDITTGLISDVIITRESILNKKSFEFKKGVQNIPEKDIL